MAQATTQKTDESDKPFSPWDRLHFFEPKERGPGISVIYDRGRVNLSYYDGYCRIVADHHQAKYQYSFGTGGKFAVGDYVAFLGSIFRVEEDDHPGKVYRRLNEKTIPKGLKPPRWDSITLLRTGYTGFSGWPDVGVLLGDLNIAAGGEQEASASLSVKWVYTDKPRKTPDVLHQATVKAGDILLLRDKGHVVRAIVPPNPETRVVGWIELAPEPLAEADLVRDKKKFVRPTPIAEKGGVN